MLVRSTKHCFVFRSNFMSDSAEEIHKKHKEDNDNFEKRKKHIEKSEDLSENTEQALDAVSGVSQGIDTFLDKFGPLGTFIASGIALVMIPLQCIREHRWPSKNEWMKLGLCVAAIVLGVLAITSVLGAGLLIAAIIGSAFISLGKAIQNYRIAKEELDGLEKLAHYKQDLNDEIKHLESLGNLCTAEQATQLKEQKDKLEHITKQYPNDDARMKKLREQLNQSKTRYLHIGAGGAFTLGTILSVIPVFPLPLIGIILMIGTVLLSAIIMGVSALRRKLNSKKLSLNKQHQQTPVTTTTTDPHPTLDAAQKALQQHIERQTASYTSHKDHQNHEAHTNYAPEHIQLHSPSCIYVTPDEDNPWDPTKTFHPKEPSPIHVEPNMSQVHDVIPQTQYKLNHPLDTGKSMSHADHKPHDMFTHYDAATSSQNTSHFCAHLTPVHDSQHVLDEDNIHTSTFSA